MTLDEFNTAEPALAQELRRFIGDRGAIDGVYLDGDRWIAHTTHAGVVNTYVFELALEARCLPTCLTGGPGGRPRTWIWEGHECCVACDADPSHYYSTVHE